MYLLVQSTDGTPDYWAFQEHELVELLAMRDEMRIKSEKCPLILHVPSFPGAQAQSLFDPEDSKND